MLFKFKRKEEFIDSFVLTVGRNITFIVASIISAIINISFIGNLSHDSVSIGFINLSSAAIMIGISLALEGSKLIHILTYNTLNELIRKLNDKKYSDAKDRVQQVARHWLIGYLFFALLSILSAANFSLMNIGKSTTSMDAEVRLYEQIIEQNQELLELSKKKEELENNLDSIVSSTWTKHLEAIQLYRTNLINQYNRLSSEEKSRLNWDWSNIRDSQGEKIYQGWIEYREQFNRNYSTDYNNLELAALKKIDFEQDVSLSSLKEIQRLETEMEAKQKTLNKKLDQKSITIEEINYALEDAKNARILESGSQAGIRKLSEIFKIKDVSILIAAFIFLLSALVELTIYQTSPKVKISRKMLFQFSQYLPKNFSVDDFMKEIEKELISYDIIEQTHKDRIEIKRSEIELTKAKNRTKTKALKKQQQSLEKDKELEDLVSEAKILLGNK